MSVVKITYEKGVHKYYRSNIVARRYDTCTFDGYWWSQRLNGWVSTDSPSIHFRFNTKRKRGLRCGLSSNYQLGKRFSESVVTHRQFKRLVRKWSEYLPEGVEFIWISRYVGPLDAYAKTIKLPQYDCLKRKGRKK